MKIYTHTKQYGNRFYLAISVDGRYITLSGFSSLDDARHQAELIVQQLQNGETTVEELRKRRKFRGKTTVEWAAHFNVSRNALYKAARNKNISVEEEILRRLPICER